MQLSLKYPPTVENAAKFAEDIVDSAEQISGVHLDFSVDSLTVVDNIIEGLRHDGCKADEIAEVLFSFGCYVGEVFVRHAGGQWRNTAETSVADLIGFPLVIERGSENFCNPIGKVFKRMQNGADDSLPFFYEVFSTHE